MTNKDRRRKSRRYPVRWKTALVFDKADNRPIFHTQTQDLSVGGTAVYSERGDLEGTTVTVMLARPAPPGGEMPKMLKIRAQVVSSVFVSSKGAYRVGLKFIPSSDDVVGVLSEVLNASEPEAAESASTAPAPALPAPASGRLAQLKQLAQAKQAQAPAAGSQEAIGQRVDAALRKAHAYFKELVDSLNVVRPAFPRAYVIAGVPPLEGLAWQGGRVDLRTGEQAGTSKRCEQVGLYYSLGAARRIEVTRENPSHERLRQVLAENKIEFTTKEVRNERGMLDQTVFSFPCEVSARLVLAGDYRDGTIGMSTWHVARFGGLDYRFAPEAITDEALEQLAGFVLGESAAAGPLFARRT